MKKTWIWMFSALLVTIAATPMYAQTNQEMHMRALADQPGYVPNASEEPLDAIYQRQPVFYRTTEAPGTIVVSTSERFMYLVEGNSRAIRSGIGVGRDGFQWAGIHRITRKAEGPDWQPPPAMIESQHYLPRFMAGGPGNPLGARALYIGTTVYRIHGT